MIWILIISLTAVVFSLRYIFLIPQLPIRLPLIVRQALSYSAPCLLTAICAPVILLENHELRSFPDNPYLWGALFCVVAASLLKNMLVTVGLTLVFFYGLIYFMG
ncbi:AzlD domain-containing protein [Providencia sp. PROV188]|jgi:branched-subunit amino acid transport protein|uniref:AzlD domain-containing protein n=1 Tax=Providencia zhijiangensis TaxID=3053982 RepID=A0ABZ0N6R8_9GAMM|nr:MULTISPECIES: AzlD domain-containing protein [Providencia]MTC74480.1 AzlD domain-containing protein [Providencia sp. wls1919]ETT03355.1 branched-chain amino acid transport protein AzlD [Providencia alcalifaciens PAL-3]EUD00727.1 branched-chain amino acid transport protein AzlD [Providencia alcalifaciens PAL-1]MBG5882096.1 AzlD domain-containing protein [Providencia alcalifaciens]MBS0925979.1 AzlD domain-containing protein [Providencia sp. JGM181]